MCVSVILAPGRQAGGCRGNPQLATQRITQLQCLTPARCPTQTQPLLNGIQCMRLTGPSATQAETLPWNSSHCIRTSVLLSYNHVLLSVYVCEFVCEGSSGCLANAIFCRNPTRRGAEVLLFQIPLQLRSSTPVLVSFQMFHSFHQDLENDKQIALDRKKSYFPRKIVIISKNFLGGP